jgi:hypothetical protein
LPCDFTNARTFGHATPFIGVVSFQNCTTVTAADLIVHLGGRRSSESSPDVLNSSQSVGVIDILVFVLDFADAQLRSAPVLGYGRITGGRSSRSDPEGLKSRRFHCADETIDGAAALLTWPPCDAN